MAVVGDGRAISRSRKPGPTDECNSGQVLNTQCLCHLAV